MRYLYSQPSIRDGPELWWRVHGICNKNYADKIILVLTNNEQGKKLVSYIIKLLSIILEYIVDYCTPEYALLGNKRFIARQRRAG